MTAVEILRLTVRYKLRVCKHLNFKHHDHCMVLADALEEDGEALLATFWRLVADRRIWPDASRTWDWPKKSVLSKRVYEWWCPPDDWYYQTTPMPHWIRPLVFKSLQGKEREVWAPYFIPAKCFPSLAQAILSLEKAWGAVDCEAASV